MTEDALLHAKGELSRAAIRYTEEWVQHARGAGIKGELDARWLELTEAAIRYTFAINQSKCSSSS